MYDDSVGRALALSAGANLVVSKPSGGWKLIECVQSLLEAAWPPASTRIATYAGGFRLCCPWLGYTICRRAPRFDF